MSGAVVISGSSCFSVSSFTWSSESSVICPVTMELALVYDFQSLSSFVSFHLLFSTASFLVTFTVHHIDKTSASMSVWHPPSYQTCTPIAIHAYGFLFQALEEWINKKSVHGYDVLLTVAFKEHRPSTNRNSVVQLLKFAFRVKICYWSRHHFTRRAHQSLLSLCSGVHPLQNHLLIWSSVSVVLLHPSRWRAISIETPIIHIWPSSILQPRYCQQTGLSSLRRHSL